MIVALMVCVTTLLEDLTVYVSKDTLEMESTVLVCLIHVHSKMSEFFSAHSYYTQISMSVVCTTVTLMLHVPTLLGVITVYVTKDTLEMEPLVKVQIHFQHLK